MRTSSIVAALLTLLAGAGAALATDCSVEEAATTTSSWFGVDPRAPGRPTSFAGRWRDSLDNPITLIQDAEGNAVARMLDRVLGGSIRDNVFTFTWADCRGRSGDGKWVIEGPGPQGWFVVNLLKGGAPGDPVAQDGTLSLEVPAVVPFKGPRVDMAGSWTYRDRHSSWRAPLMDAVITQQPDGFVRGTQGESEWEGWVVGDTLFYWWLVAERSRAGYGRDYRGVGQLVLNPEGTRLTVDGRQDYSPEGTFTYGYYLVKE